MKTCYLNWHMKELLILQRKLEGELEIIRKAIEIQSNHSETSKNGFAKLVILDVDKIEEIIMEIEGDFNADDVRAKIAEKFEDKASYEKSRIGTALFRLVSAKKLEYVSERSGRKPAIYHKH
jgi:hypothetical protein